MYKMYIHWLWYILLQSFGWKTSIQIVMLLLHKTDIQIFLLMCTLSSVTLISPPLEFSFDPGNICTLDTALVVTNYPFHFLSRSHYWGLSKQTQCQDSFEGVLKLWCCSRWPLIFVWRRLRGSVSVWHMFKRDIDCVCVVSTNIDRKNITSRWLELRTSWTW